VLASVNHPATAFQPLFLHPSVLDRLGTSVPSPPTGMFFQGRLRTDESCLLVVQGCVLDSSDQTGRRPPSLIYPPFPSPLVIVSLRRRERDWLGLGVQRKLGGHSFSPLLNACDEAPYQEEWTSRNGVTRASTTALQM